MPSIKNINMIIDAIVGVLPKKPLTDKRDNACNIQYENTNIFNINLFPLCILFIFS